MGGVSSTIDAPTKTELKKLVTQWERMAKDAGLGDIRLGYDPGRVETTEEGGYKIQVWAHT